MSKANHRPTFKVICSNSGELYEQRFFVDLQNVIPFNIVKSEDAPSYGAQGKESEQLPQKVILLYPDNTFKVFNSH